MPREKTKKDQKKKIRREIEVSEWNKLVGKAKEGKEGKVKNQDLNWVFSADRDERGKLYYQDGNPLLYTDENLKKRADLRKDPMVNEGIQDVTQN